MRKISLYILFLLLLASCARNPMAGWTEGPKINHYQGTSWYIDIPYDGTVTIKYYGRPLPRQSWAPEGFVMQQKGKPDKPMQVKYNFIKHPKNDTVDDDFICRYTPQPGDFNRFYSIIVEREMPVWHQNNYKFKKRY